MSGISLVGADQALVARFSEIIDQGPTSPDIHTRISTLVLEVQNLRDETARDSTLALLRDTLENRVKYLEKEPKRDEAKLDFLISLMQNLRPFGASAAVPFVSTAAPYRSLEAPRPSQSRIPFNEASEMIVHHYMTGFTDMEEGSWWYTRTDAGSYCFESTYAPEQLKEIRGYLEIKLLRDRSFLKTFERRIAELKKIAADPVQLEAHLNTIFPLRRFENTPLNQYKRVLEDPNLLIPAEIEKLLDLTGKISKIEDLERLQTFFYAKIKSMHSETLPQGQYESLLHLTLSFRELTSAPVLFKKFFTDVSSLTLGNYTQIQKIIALLVSDDERDQLIEHFYNVSSQFSDLPQEKVEVLELIQAALLSIEGIHYEESASNQLSPASSPPQTSALTPDLNYLKRAFSKVQNISEEQRLNIITMLLGIEPKKLEMTIAPAFQSFIRNKPDWSPSQFSLLMEIQEICKISRDASN